MWVKALVFLKNHSILRKKKLTFAEMKFGHNIAIPVCTIEFNSMFVCLIIEQHTFAQREVYCFHTHKTCNSREEP